MTVALPSLPATWNPDSATDEPTSQPIRDVEAPLLQLTPRTQQVTAGLARSWHWNSSRTHLTLDLRPKAEFSNGHHVSAKDVVFSVDQWLHGPEHGSYYSALFSGATAHGRSTVVLDLPAPSSAALDALTLTSSAVVPDNFDGHSAADFYAHPVGAGPFAITSASSTAIDLTRNKHFYDRSHPYLTHLDYRADTDPGAELHEVGDGGTELAAGLPAADVTGSHGHARVVTTPSAATSMLTFSPSWAPAQDLSFRKAVSLAIDRSTLVSSVYDGKAAVAPGLLPHQQTSTGGCTSCDWSQHDVARARSLSAAVPGHQHVTLVVDATDPDDVSTAREITAMLAQAGITVHTQALAPAALAQRLSSNRYQMALRTLVAQTPAFADPLRTLVTGHYLAPASATKAAQAALQTAQAATRLADSTAAGTAFEQTAFATTAAVPLVDPDLVDVAAQDVRGLDVLPTGLFHSAGLWLKTG
jgi:peptide/nickel transport system substrate-binding protein